MLDRKKRKQARNNLLRLLGLRWTDSIQVSDPQRDDYRAVYRATFETRPWWRDSHVVEKEQMTELTLSEARELHELRQTLGTPPSSKRGVARVIERAQNLQ